jgi:hypothetical protein
MTYNFPQILSEIFTDILYFMKCSRFSFLYGIEEKYLQ